ncbi:glutathione S-transferase family protein [Phaeobacter inhibens]|uniref:glutathione S-transferase family protein n=1 Tax=Phaeobacter inhibens TaxID=221822 RepID=UPI000C9C93AC|nr:glutathione S-transferase family protein [Phaeobacter inhibens]AUQ68403.1 beta-etherase TdaB, GST [Phaeobacter inhibens]
MDRRLYSLCGEDGKRHYSPHVWKIIMALNHKGLEYDLIPVSFADIPSVEDGSYRSVPVLRDGNTVLGESFDIARYLDETYADAPALFDGKGAVALTRFVESYCKTVLHPSLATIAVMDMHNLMSPADQVYFRSARERRFGMPLEVMAEGGEAERALLPEKLSPVRDLLATQDWLSGAMPAYADYTLFGTLQWCNVCAPNTLFEKDGLVSNWFERCLDLYDGVGRSSAQSDRH